MDIEEAYSKFVLTLKKFLEKLHEISPKDGTEKMLKYFNKIRMDAIIKRYFTIMKKYNKHLETRNEEIFNKNIYILPDVNISEYWIDFNAEQKKKMWNYIHSMFILCEMMIINSQMKDNVFKGGEKKEFSMNKMFEGSELKKDYNPGSINELMKLAGIDKMIDVEELTSSLKNMKQEEIDEASKNIMGMIGVDENNEKMKNMLGGLLGDISGELKSRDFSQGNPIDSILSIAESVANKMKPKVDSGEIDIKDILQSATGLTGTLNAGGDNPLGALGQMMANMGNMTPQQMQHQMQQMHNNLPPELREQMEQMKNNLPPELKQMNKKQTKKGKGRK